jgi:hypothetical protein
MGECRFRFHSADRHFKRGLLTDYLRYWRAWVSSLQLCDENCSRVIIQFLTCLRTGNCQSRNCTIKKRKKISHHDLPSMSHVRDY